MNVTPVVRSDKRKKVRLGMWEHPMRLPGHGSDVNVLWCFVAAHVEDRTRVKPCPLAVKAWRHLQQSMWMTDDDKEEQEMLPQQMPERRQDSFFDMKKLRWTTKWVQQ